MEAVTALHDRFPKARITLDPQWSLVAQGGNRPLQPANMRCWPTPKIPAGPKMDFPAGKSWPSSARKPASKPRRTWLPTDFRQLEHALKLEAVDIPLAVPHFWTMSGSVHVAHLCQQRGLTWGFPFEQSFRHFLGALYPRRRRRPGNVTAIDTPTGSGRKAANVSPNPRCKIRNGKIELPTTPGPRRHPRPPPNRRRSRPLQIPPPPGSRDDTAAMHSSSPTGPSTPTPLPRTLTPSQPPRPVSASSNPSTLGSPSNLTPLIKNGSASRSPPPLPAPQYENPP